MNLADLIKDSYERKARLYPGLVLAAPAVVTAVAIISATLSTLESIVIMIAGFGGAFLLSHLVRDAGKKGENALFERWKGLPSAAIFRHRDTRLDSITKGRYHKKLTALVKGAKAPSVKEEQADPAAADQVYIAWSTYLRVNTRDTKKYPLLFQENVNYGYRRNIWSLRPFGIITSALSCAIAAARLYQLYRASGKIDQKLAGAFAFALVFLLLWIFRFSSYWVRIPAHAYAERLAETVDTIGETRSI